MKNYNLKILSNEWKKRVCNAAPVQRNALTTNSMIVFIIVTVGIFVVAYFMPNSIDKIILFITFAIITLIIISLFFMFDDERGYALEKLTSIKCDKVRELFEVFLEENKMNSAEDVLYLKMALSSRSEARKRRKDCGDKLVGYIIPIITGIIGILISGVVSQNIQGELVIIYSLLALLSVVFLFAYAQIFQMFFDLVETRYIMLETTIEYITEAGELK